MWELNKARRVGRGDWLFVEFQMRTWSKKQKTAAACAGRSLGRPALAAFVKRPQAELKSALWRSVCAILICVKRENSCDRIDLVRGWSAKYAMMES